MPVMEKKGLQYSTVLSDVTYTLLLHDASSLNFFCTKEFRSQTIQPRERLPVILFCQQNKNGDTSFVLSPSVILFSFFDSDTSIVYLLWFFSYFFIFCFSF